MVTERRTRKDRGLCIQELDDKHDPRTKMVVKDNGNTHNGARLYETFPPEEARHLPDRLERLSTPRYGS